MLIIVSASVGIFTGIILLLTLIIIVVERNLVPQGKIKININDEKTVEVSGGSTLLSALSNEKIFIPSACGGGGTCAMCKCKVLTGGGNILPTEKTHISKGEERENFRLACQVKIREDMTIRVPDEIFSIKQFVGTVSSNENVSTFIKNFNVSIDQGQTLKFQAGGYIQITVPEGEYSFKDFDIPKEYRTDWDKFNLWRYKTVVSEELFRAYSMANHPAEGNKINLTIRIATPPPNNPEVSPGLCSSYIFSLKAGDKVNFSGPYGEFFIKDTAREMVYIGGGAGMAPMRSHLFHLFHTLKTGRKVTFFYGARSLKENFFYEDFIAIEKNFPNFKYVLALSNPLPEDNWKGPVGFIHQVASEYYLKDHEDPTEIEYYLCGPPMMIDAVCDMVYDLGVEDEMIAFDKF
jgi:Na+-transporting NADH:ubiquinone oxidoreductase subunit F